MVQRYRNQNNKVVAKQRKSRSAFSLSCLIISMLIECYLVILVITVLSYIQFIHVMMLLPVYMLKVTGLTRLMSDLVLFRLFSSVPPGSQGGNTQA